MNPTGIKPVEYKVLIEVEELEKQIGRILIPETAREREQTAHDRGMLVDCGGMAFSDWQGAKPKPGSKVIFNKYAGSIIQFREDRELKKYRLCNDKDISAILEETDG